MNRDNCIVQSGRAKAYRPMPAAARRRAFEAGLAAYANGDFFLAHELLEPAWLGTRDLPERELLQGLIKLAAAFVHGARSNPVGIEKNLRGARAHLKEGLVAGKRLGVDVQTILAEVDERLRSDVAAGDPPIPIPRRARS